MDVLNEDYASAGITFNLLGITRTTNSAWYSDSNETAMKTALRQGDYKTLNVYFQNLGDGLLGYCYFPTSNPTASDLRLDGCSILSTSVPGGTTTSYNLGRTATHEIGHWFGICLYLELVSSPRESANCLWSRSLPHLPGWLHWW